jgi:hypothetical protein
MTLAAHAEHRGNPAMRKSATAPPAKSETKTKAQASPGARAQPKGLKPLRTGLIARPMHLDLEVDRALEKKERTRCASWWTSRLGRRGQGPSLPERLSGGRPRPVRKSDLERLGDRSPGRDK